MQFGINLKLVSNYISIKPSKFFAFAHSNILSNDSFYLEIREKLKLLVIYYFFYILMHLEFLENRNNRKSFNCNFVFILKKMF